MISIYLSILEGLYIIYMFNYFKTTKSIHHPFEIYMIGLNKYLKHPIYSGKYENKICNFGKDISWYIALYLILRHVFLKNKWISKNIILNINKLLLILGCVLSLLTNLNAFVYLLPVLIIEFFSIIIL